MWRKRAEDLFAAFVIGNGVLDLIAPRRRLFLWVFGPERLRKLILWFADHPAAMRLRGIARVGLGIGLALRQYRKTPEPSWYQSWFPRYRWARDSACRIASSCPTHRALQAHQDRSSPKKRK